MGICAHVGHKCGWLLTARSDSVRTGSGNRKVSEHREQAAIG